MRSAIVLLAHGSRDPRWREPVEAVAARVAQLAPGAMVRLAYLELCEPDFATAVAASVAGGATRVRVVPLFLGMGRHAREDLPRLADAARSAHAGLSVEVAPAVGEHPELIDLLARLALSEPDHP